MRLLRDVTVLQISVERRFGTLVSIRKYLAMFSMALSSLPRTLYRVSYFVVAQQRFRIKEQDIEGGKMEMPGSVIASFLIAQFSYLYAYKNCNFLDVLAKRLKSIAFGFDRVNTVMCMCIYDR